MHKGDIVLITFPFTDLSGNKLRPAVVLFTGSSDVTVCFITTQIHFLESSDLLIKPSSANGLRKESLIRTGKIATLDKKLARGLLGNLSKKEVEDLNSQLKVLLQL